MSSVHRLFIISFAFGWAGIGLSGQPAESATAPAPTAASETVPAAPEFIELAKIPREVESLEALLREYADIDHTGLIGEITEQIPGVKESVSQAARRIVSLRGTSVSSQRLVAVRAMMEESENQLQEWQDQLSTAINHTGEAINQTAQLVTLWGKTRDRAIEEETPGTVLTQIRASLSSTIRAHAELLRKQDAALEAQGEVGIELRHIGKIESELNKMMEATRASLFQPDSPPLWKLFSAHESDRTLKDLKQFTSENLSVLAHWAGGRVVALSIWAGSFLAVVGFIFAIRRTHLERLVSDDRLETTATLVYHPFSTGILAILLLVPILLPHPTEAFSWVTTLLAVPALLRLIPSLIHPDLQPLARGTVVVYLISRLAYMLAEGSNLARLLYISVEILICTGGIHYLLRSAGNEYSKPSIRLICRLVVGLSVAAFAAHFFGLSILGATLVQGTASSAFTGLAMIVVGSVVIAFFRLLAILGPLQYLESVKRHFSVMERQFRRILFWFLTIIWLIRLLRSFTLWDVTANAAMQFLNREWQFGSVTISIGAISLFIFAVWASVMVSRLIRFFLENDVLSRLGLPRGVPGTISMMLNYGIITLGFMFALAAIGVDLSQISLLIGALGVGIGFGLQNIVNNFISGLILIFERPINVGDLVQFDTTTGRVLRIGLRSSVVRSFEGAEIIVPNGNLISNEVINWTLSDQTKRMTIPIGVAYGTDPQTVLALLEKTAGQQENLLSEPAPWAVFEGFGDSSLDFTLRCWAHADNWLLAKSALTVAVNHAIVEAGIEIPFPQRDLHLRSVDPSTGMGPGGSSNSATPGSA